MKDNNHSVKKSRNRGITLDPKRVQAQARKHNISHFHEFETAYYVFHKIKPEVSVTAPENAWYGKVMDKKYAKKVADLLGLSELSELLPQTQRIDWVTLLADFKSEDSLFDWQFEESEADKKQETWRNVDFSLLHQTGKTLPLSYDINAKWNLTLYGEPGEQFAIFLQSDRGITQLAPRHHPMCHSEIEPKQSTINFPREPLIQFSKEDGPGKRTLFVIRASKISLPPKTEDSVQFITESELERFCEKLISESGDSLVVNICEFMVTE